MFIWKLLARINALQLPHPERSILKSIVTFTASEWPGEPTQSAEFLALTNVGKAITSRDLESVLCSTNEAKFQAEKIRLLGLDTLIQNTSKPWIFEDSTKETIIFGKHLLNLLSRPPLDTTN